MDSTTMDTKRRPVKATPVVEVETPVETAVPTRAAPVEFVRLTAAYQIGPTVEPETASRLRSFLNQRGLKEIVEGRYAVDYLLQAGFTEEEVRATASNVTIIATRGDRIDPGPELVRKVFALYGKG